MGRENYSDILQYGKSCIQDELDSLSALTSQLDEDFAHVVIKILESKGRVVITGIGKSAIIAQKIVATMNSTGTPSIFMHAADAIHGDLGIIQTDDIVIAISKSGNTPEIKALAPLLKQFGNPLVAIVGNIDSNLALSADYILNTTVEKEACPNNLAPTTSTTAQLLMGDALAVALLKCKNFSSSDFSKYHPGGALGKRLYLTCKDIALGNMKPLVNSQDSIQNVIIEISKKRLGATMVIDQGKLAGIITDGDIRRMIEKTSDLSGIKALDILNPHPKSIDANELAANAAVRMREEKISQLAVLENGEYIGMIHIHDLNKEGLL
ncbi:MAG: KpsF/GutQ family sugar-phosphate isomerase [Bacteroidia bacterium]|nr:KpsF/GutQ family sugar-phosphate isomerase [Bacteroidia bacterium]